ncbi:MAG: N-acetyl-gamma-glutamyl-phosphate reductase [Clostridia bacterium]|nr:N-acetyl-gamma-glutamyl-phosphate reductase [Clostridia bacterium]
MIKVFVDGQEGTTGLQITDRLIKREDVSLIRLPDELRKDPSSRLDAMKQADITFLCLPDAAAKEAAVMAQDTDTCVIDASTAHRVLPDWAYGFPELGKEWKDKIASSKKIANVGCHASGFISLVYPLVKSGVLSPDYPLVCHSVTGYSGGGKKMIAQYEDSARDVEYDSPRQYGLLQAHKHLPEMQVICGLTQKPLFSPIVSDFYSGMVVSVPLYLHLLEKKVSGSEIRDILAAHYDGAKLISVLPFNQDPGFLAGNHLAGKDTMEILVTGTDDRLLLTSTFDNLGKGASGSAVQNMNIHLGLEETTGLVL